jgi:simple sugar transport system ATP-binding protein
VIGCADVSRSFGATRALDRVGFSARPGSVHGILGENGAGKSTLMRILFGLDQPDTGTVLIDDRVVRLDSPRSAVALGIGMVHQHFTLVPTLSVLDSCILAAGRGLGVVDRRQWRKRLAATAENLQWQLDPQALIRDLSVGERQRVEIVKALLTGGRCLILDEPTAVLTPQEVDELLPALRSLADGGTTVLFISHKLHEVQRLCDKLTILRRGRVVHDGPAGGVSREQLAELLLGAMPPPAVRSAAQAPGAPRLQVQNLHRGSLREVSFAVAGGEIVGIAGVDGNGQAPLVQAILSDETAVETPGLPAAERLGGAHRLGLIPDDRQHEALVLPLSITATLALKDHRRPP